MFGFLHVQRTSDIGRKGIEKKTAVQGWHCSAPPEATGYMNRDEIRRRRSLINV